MKLKLLLCAALAFFAFGTSAQAQTPVVVQCSVNNPINPWVPCSSGNPLPVSASVTASIAPFLPSASGSRGTQFTVNTTTTAQTLPTGAAVVVSNEGTTNTMYCNAVGASATTADQPISPNGGWFVFGTANAGGSINCIASGGTTTANMVGGGGLPAGTGGGSGGGGGGTVNQGTGGASAWLVTGTAGTFPATQSGTWNITNISGTISLPTGAATAANQSTANTSLATIATNTGAAVPAGTNIIGGTIPTPSSSSSFALSHASGASASLTFLVAKASAGNLYGYNCTAISGAAAGFCVVYNGTSAPATGALTAANVLDFCYFGTTAAGCSLSRIPMGVNYSSGIVVLITSATTPYTYTTGTDTGAITADYD